MIGTLKMWSFQGTNLWFTRDW